MTVIHRRWLVFSDFLILHYVLQPVLLSAIQTANFFIPNPLQHQT